MMGYLAMLLAGALVCNALPHLVAGVRGERFYTPWTIRRGDGTASAIENMLWGAANLFLGLYVADRVFWDNLPHGLVVFAAGFVLMGLTCAWLFAERRGR